MANEQIHLLLVQEAKIKKSLCIDKNLTFRIMALLAYLPLGFMVPILITFLPLLELSFTMEALRPSSF